MESKVINNYWNKFNPTLGFMPIQYDPAWSGLTYETRYGKSMTKDKFVRMVMNGEEIPYDQTKPQYAGKYEYTTVMSGNWHRATNRDIFVQMLRYIKSRGAVGSTYHEVCKNVIKKPVGYDRDTFLTLCNRFLESFTPETGELKQTSFYALTRNSYFCLNQFGDDILKFADSNEPIAELESRFSKVMKLVKDGKSFVEASMWLMMHDGECITADDVKYWLSEIEKFRKHPRFQYFKSRLYNYKKFLTAHYVKNG